MLVVFLPTVPGFAFVRLRRLVEVFCSPPPPAVSSRHQISFAVPARGVAGAILRGVSSRRFPGDSTQPGSSLAHVRSLCRRSICTMSRSARGVSSAVFCSGAIPALMAQPEISLGEIIPSLPYVYSALGTRRRNMLSMTARRALAEFIPCFRLLPTLGGLGMGGSWVVPLWFPTLPGRSSVSGVLVSLFVEVVVVV